MKISLVFPPPFDLTQPYLSVPTLSAYLKENGHETIQRDLNIELYDHFISSETLTGILARIGDQIEGLNGAGGSAARSSKAVALHKAKRICSTLIPLCPQIKGGFRRPEEFFDPVSYSRNIRLLHRACEVISTAYHPSQLTPIAFRMAYRTSSVAQILEAIEDEKQNVFYHPFEAIYASSILEEYPDLIGISVVYTDQIIPALTLCRLIRRSAPDARIVIGGDVFSRMVRTNLDSMAPFFDLVNAFVLDDGRQPLSSICERIEKGLSLDGIPRVVTRETREVPLRPTSFDNLPVPDYGGLPTSLYFSPEPILPLLAGKGCKWGRCTFCTESFTKEYFPKSIPTLVGEIDSLVREFGITCLNFADVDISLERMKELSRALIEKDYQVYWSTRARLEKGLDKEACQLLARGGCRKLYFGLETASQRVLNRMRKGIRIERVPAMLEACQASGIAVHLFSFVGFPGETREEAYSTMEFLVEHSKYLSSFNIGNFYFRTFSDIAKDAETYGVRPIENDDIDADLDKQGYVVEDGMEMEEAEEVAFALAAEAYRRLAEQGGEFETYRASRYIKRAGFPAYDSHNLAYLARYSNTWMPQNGAEKRSAVDDASVLLVQPFVELSRAPAGTSIVFSPVSAKMLRIPTRNIDLLRACDGRRSVGQLKANFEAALAGATSGAPTPPEPSVSERDGPPRANEMLATLSRALEEGLVAEVERA